VAVVLGILLTVGVISSYQVGILLYLSKYRKGSAKKLGGGKGLLDRFWRDALISYLGGRKREVVLGIGLVLLLNSLSFCNVQSINLSRGWSYPSGFDPHGPYIDQLR
jgi:hypothetical protein